MIDLSTPRLDITTWKQKGLQLNEAIQKEIKGLSKSLIFMPMPAILEMRQDQYNDLMEVGKLPNMYHQEDRMYVTPYNVMEVRVTNRSKLTFREAQALSDKDFDKWEKSVEGETDD